MEASERSSGCCVKSHKAGVALCASGIQRSKWSQDLFCSSNL